MPKKREDKKDVDIHLRIDNVEKLMKESKKWHEHTKHCHHGPWGFWGFGSALAIVLSYVQNSSIFWAILHGIISWFYVIYRIFVDYHIFG